MTEQRYPHTGTMPREVTDPTYRPEGYYKTPDGLPPVMPTDEERAEATRIRNTPAEKIIRHARLRLMMIAGAATDERHRYGPHGVSADTRDTLWMAREAFKEALKDRTEQKAA